VKAKSLALTGCPSLQRERSRIPTRYVLPSSETSSRSARAGRTLLSRSSVKSPRNRWSAIHQLNVDSA
jgi:hypothetical protein